MLEIPETLPLVYFGSKYLIAIVAIWFGFHFWITGKGNDVDMMLDFRPWYERHPIALILVGSLLGGFMLYGLNDNVHPEPYWNLLMFGEPFLNTWFTIGTLSILATGAFYMYMRNKNRYGGMISFATVMLGGFIVPYYFPYTF